MHDHPLSCHARAIVRTKRIFASVFVRVFDHTYHHSNYAHAHFLKHVMRVRTYVYMRIYVYI